MEFSEVSYVQMGWRIYMPHKRAVQIMDCADVFDQFPWLSTEIQALVGHLLAIGGQ